VNLGRVHVWERDPEAPLGGRVSCRVVPLQNLDAGGGRLSGKWVRVRNAGWLNEPRPDGEGVEPTPLEDARPNEAGDFLFDHGRGGPRVDKYTLRSVKYRGRYIEAARFGEVNAYHHLDRIASYVDELLRSLGRPSLPPVVAVVQAHHAAVVRDGVRDGERRPSGIWRPFEGGHYRLSTRPCRLLEFEPVAPQGEIHFGPGQHLLAHGALVDMARARYRHNTAHNGGVIYHEYGHHVSRHTADFRANALAPPDRQSNRKTALDEGYCDYWSATILDVPHIWVWHRSHLVGPPHARSLTSRRTAADFDHAPGADPHANGTIWASALWDLRVRLGQTMADGHRSADLLVLQSLLELGRVDSAGDSSPAAIRRARAGLSAGLDALLRADDQVHRGAFQIAILDTFGRRGIVPGDARAVRVRHRRRPRAVAVVETNGVIPEIPLDSPLLRTVLRHAGSAFIPESRDLLSATALEECLSARRESSYSLIAVGDVMLGARSTQPIAERGAEHLFAATAPLLRRAPSVLGNLEGPLASRAAREERRHSYRVRPEIAPALGRAGFNVMTLANNHLTDCGRAGVLETLRALSAAGITAVGAGVDRAHAHRPAIVHAGPLRVGVLGYYWNRRTSATESEPGSAMDPPEALHADITALRDSVDRVVVTFHWGVPYERDPSPEDRAKARLAIQLGADIVVGHHPHVIQPFEVCEGCPIFYSVGNFAFGSGNSRAEGLLLAIRFDEERTRTEVYPLYVKNRDPRVRYQPKVMVGEAGQRCLTCLAEVSGDSGAHLVLDGLCGVIDLPRRSRAPAGSHGRIGAVE